MAQIWNSASGASSWKAGLCSIGITCFLVGLLVWRLAIWESPRYTVHENTITGQVYVKLHNRADRQEWKTHNGVYRKHLQFSTVKEACKWVKVRHALHDKTDLINDSWKEVECGSDKAQDPKKW